MFNKNAKDPVADSVRKVMEQNEKERAAARAVNEKFGIVDRRALPHERQPEWDAAYKKVLSEGVEALDEISKGKVAQYALDAASDMADAGADHAIASRELNKKRLKNRNYWKDAKQDSGKRYGKRLKGLEMATKKLGREKLVKEEEKVEEGLKMGDYGHSKEKIKALRLKAILKRRQGKGDGSESVEQSRREDK